MATRRPSTRSRIAAPTPTHSGRTPGARARGALATAAVALVGAAAAAEPPSGARQREMISALPAPGPHRSLGDRARAFDWLVGTWDAEFTHHAADGTLSTSRGQVLFGWILDGWALQDIWWDRAGDAEREIGTTIRFYDARAGTWRVTWFDPARGVVQPLAGGPVGDRIVLRGQGSDGRLLRWSFHDIQADSFAWRGEVSHDQGETWRKTGEYRMRRAPAAR